MRGYIQKTHSMFTAIACVANTYATIFSTGRCLAFDSIVHISHKRSAQTLNVMTQSKSCKIIQANQTVGIAKSARRTSTHTRNRSEIYKKKRRKNINNSTEFIQFVFFFFITLFAHGASEISELLYCSAVIRMGNAP